MGPEDGGGVGMDVRRPPRSTYKSLKIQIVMLRKKKSIDLKKSKHC